MIETIFFMDGEEEMTPGTPNEGGDGGGVGGDDETPSPEPSEPEGRFDEEGDDSATAPEARLGDEDEEDGSDSQE